MFASNIDILARDITRLVIFWLVTSANKLNSEFNSTEVVISTHCQF